MAILIMIVHDIVISRNFNKQLVYTYVHAYIIIMTCLLQQQNA